MAQNVIFKFPLKRPKIGTPSDFYLMASTFDIAGGIMSKKNFVLDFHRWGCTVILSDPWTNTKNDRKCTKSTFE